VALGIDAGVDLHSQCPRLLFLRVVERHCPSEVSVRTIEITLPERHTAEHPGSKHVRCAITGSYGQRQDMLAMHLRLRKLATCVVHGEQPAMHVDQQCLVAKVLANRESLSEASLGFRR